MYTGGALEQRDLDGVGSVKVSIADFICYRNKKYSLQELRGWLGDDKFIDFINAFAGCYIIIPANKKIVGYYYEYMAALAVLKIKAAKKKRDFKEWNNQEEKLHQIAKKMRRLYRNVYMKGVKAVRDFEKIDGWKKNLVNWQKKHTEGKR